MESSCTILVEVTRKPCFFSTSTTAGPERSTRSPREQESLTVMTAAVSSAGGRLCADTSVIEEDIIFLFRAATRAWTRAAGAGAARTGAAQTGAAQTGAARTRYGVAGSDGG